MGDTTASTASPTDGRRARRERGRTAVIDAVFELRRGGQGPGHSGTGRGTLRGVGRVDLPVLRRPRRPPVQTLPADSANGSHRCARERRRVTRADRIAAFVDSRLDLYEQAGAMMALGRLRALEHAPLLEASSRNQSSARRPGPSDARSRHAGQLPRSSGRTRRRGRRVHVARGVGRDAQDARSIAGADRHDLAPRHRGTDRRLGTGRQLT